MDFQFFHWSGLGTVLASFRCLVNDRRRLCCGFFVASVRSSLIVRVEAWGEEERRSVTQRTQSDRLGDKDEADHVIAGSQNGRSMTGQMRT